MVRKDGWTIDDLVQEFRGKFGGTPGDRSYEQPRTFFERVLSGKPSWDGIIPYRCVIEKFLRAVQYAALDGHIRRCTCGCGSAVWGRKQTATAACRQRLKRARDRAQERDGERASNRRTATTESEVFP